MGTVTESGNTNEQVDGIEPVPSPQDSQQGQEREGGVGLDTQGEQTSRGKPRGIGAAGFLYGVQEPPIFKDHITNISGAEAIFDTSIPTDQVRAALVFSNRLRLWAIDEFTEGDMATGLLKDKKMGDTYVTSVYCHDSKPAVPATLKRLMRRADQEKEVV